MGSSDIKWNNYSRFQLNCLVIWPLISFLFQLKLVESYVFSICIIIFSNSNELCNFMLKLLRGTVSPESIITTLPDDLLIFCIFSNQKFNLFTYHIYFRVLMTIDKDTIAVSISALWLLQFVQKGNSEHCISVSLSDGQNQSHSETIRTFSTDQKLFP